MRYFKLLILIFCCSIFSSYAQVPTPRGTNTPTNPVNTSGATWTKTGEIEYTIKDKNGRPLSNLKDLLYLSTDTLGVLDKNSRTIYLLADFKNASNGSRGNAVELATNVGNDFYLTNKHSFGAYFDNEYNSGEYSNIKGSYVYYLEENNACYYFDGIRNFSNWGAKSITKMKYTPTQTYWYRDVEKASYGIIQKGKAINYDNTTTEADGNDLIVKKDGVKTYRLKGYYTMASFVFTPVEMISGGSSSSTAESGCVRGNCTNGWGKFQYENAHYDGFWENGKKHGYGLYKWYDIGKYIGSWNNDTMDGYGVYIADNNDNVIGQYRNGKLNGLGITVYGKEWTQGIFSDGTASTTYDFYTNNVETGCTAGDCQNTYGRWKWDNGDSFTGFFKNGSLYLGTYTFANGEKYSGMFNSSNQFHGMGRYFYKDESYYGGEWSNGNMHGKGYYHNSDLEQQIGMWDNNTLVKDLKN